MPLFHHTDSHPFRGAFAVFVQGVFVHLTVPDQPGPEGQHVPCAHFEVFLRGLLVAVENLHVPVRQQNQRVQRRKLVGPLFPGFLAVNLSVPDDDAHPGLLPVPQLRVVIADGDNGLVLPGDLMRIGGAFQPFLRIIGDHVGHLASRCAPDLRLVPGPRRLGLDNPMDFHPQRAAGIPPQSFLIVGIDEFSLVQKPVLIQRRKLGRFRILFRSRAENNKKGRQQREAPCGQSFHLSRSPLPRRHSSPGLSSSQMIPSVRPYSLMPIIRCSTS